jgi:hypothetical protein
MWLFDITSTESEGGLEGDPLIFGYHKNQKVKTYTLKVHLK